MKKRYAYIWIWLSILIGLSSCSITKHLPEGETLRGRDRCGADGIGRSKGSYQHRSEQCYRDLSEYPLSHSLRLVGVQSL